MTQSTPSCECYPYIARRLFSDNNPRVRSALRAIMYERSSVEGQMKLNVRRFRSQRLRSGPTTSSPCPCCQRTERTEEELGEPRR